MPSAQTHVGPGTPLSAHLVPGGCTFRCWAPRAKAVWVAGSFNGWSAKDESCRLLNDGRGYWAGFLPGIAAGAQYKFYVDGHGSTNFKRDPCAREIVAPDWNCVVADPAAYPWHDGGFHPPPFEDLIIYQLHVGTFSAVDDQGRDRRHGRVATFLDVVERIPYLADLGITAVQLLPVVEFPTRFSLGYNGTDYFSPEYEYAVPEAELGPHLDRANALLAARGKGAVTKAQIRGAPAQLRLLVDLLHVHGIAVLLDVVYNHAGGDFGDESLHFFDRLPTGNNNDSLYFTDEEWAGGLVFAFWNGGVRQFLIDNAVYLLDEFHVDGLRYDEVTVIDRFGGWSFCQDLTATVRYAKPSAVQIAEFWGGDQSYAVRPPGSGGAGFDLVWHAGLRDSVRAALEGAARGRDAPVDLGRIAAELARHDGYDAGWRTVQMLENHDLVLVSHKPEDRKPRIARVADPSNPRSWYARSRARVATGLLLTGPGVPLLFMGQEFLEDKFWKDSPDDADYHLWWDGLRQDRAMADFLRFSRELIALRRQYGSLRRGRIAVFHVNDGDRVLAFHRWIEGTGNDVVVIASLSETNHYRYRLGLPRPGTWREVINSDVYDGWVNIHCAGNGGSVAAEAEPLHGMPASAALTIPANGLVVLAYAP